VWPSRSATDHFHVPPASAWSTAYCLPRYSIALVSVVALLGTRPAAQRLLEPPDRGMLRPAHDREVDRRVRFAAGACHLEETEAGIQRVAKSWLRLRRAAIAAHSQIPGFAGRDVGDLAVSLARSSDAWMEELHSRSFEIVPIRPSKRGQLPESNRARC
jgi:hypothetical protein